MRSFAPSAALSPFIRRFEIVESEGGMTRTLLPETGFAIGFRYSGGATLLEGRSSRSMPNTSITGLRRTARRMQTDPGGGLVVAKIREGCAGRFFDAPLHDLFGDTLPLAEMVARDHVERVSSHVVRAKSDEERIAAVERFFLAIARPFRPDPVVHRALRTIDASSGSARVTALAHESEMSPDAFEKRFRRSVGATPKQFASIVRLRRAVDAVRDGRTLTEVSIEAGYCDQSHFIRQFRQVTGQSPTGFFAAREHCGDIVDR